MKLWNDYEGKIIAQVYPLKKLLRPEGRSALFTTSAKDGVADVIRITESLNDEREMLERWRQVSEVRQANLVEIKTYGATTFDGVPLTYALMEATDGSLSEILEERPLTEVETIQVATSVVPALAALHAIGLVHEHIEPASVVATGEVVKLRSDCVRECLVDPEFNPKSMCDELRQRDVHDLAMLLLQCLTLERVWTSAVQVPAPFDQVIRHGLDGSWGLAEIARALQTPASLVPEHVLPAESVPEPVLRTRQPLEQQAEPQVPGPETRLRAEPEVRTTPRRLHLRRWVTSMASPALVPKRWFAAGLATLVVVLLTWFFVRRTPLGPSVPAVAQPSATEPAAGKAGAMPVRGTAGAAPMQPGWHVIAYTFLHEGQAAAKVAKVARQHPGLHPKVFAPAGHSPYFVALGGGMSESEAAGVLRTARRDGLPRDTFIRLYRSR